MTVNIRPMTQADKSDIMGLLHNTPEFTPSEVAVAEEVIESGLRDPRGSGYHILVAEVDSRVVAYICYGPTPLTEGTWDIYWMAVATEKRGRGIGSALLDQAEGQIRKAGGRSALIETSSTPAYDKTMQFHLNHGYKIVARVPDFYKCGDHKVILQKRL